MKTLKGGASAPTIDKAYESAPGILRGQIHFHNGDWVRVVNSNFRGEIDRNRTFVDENTQLAFINALMDSIAISNMYSMIPLDFLPDTDRPGYMQYIKPAIAEFSIACMVASVVIFLVGTLFSVFLLMTAN